MKKTVAIFLLAITLYNCGGYMAAFQYFIYKANKFNELQISKDRYKASELVEIKIPVHLPGIDNWRGYERVSGTVQLEQNAYNYVQMKMTSDTIYVMCVPNYKTTRLIKQNILCAREVSEAPFNAKKQTTILKPVKIVECVDTQSIKIASPQNYVAIKPAFTGKSKPVGAMLCVAGQPPESFLS